MPTDATDNEVEALRREVAWLQGERAAELRAIQRTQAELLAQQRAMLQWMDDLLQVSKAKREARRLERAKRGDWSPDQEEAEARAERAFIDEHLAHLHEMGDAAASERLKP